MILSHSFQHIKASIKPMAIKSSVTNNLIISRKVVVINFDQIFDRSLNVLKTMRKNRIFLSKGNNI